MNSLRHLGDLDDVAANALEPEDEAAMVDETPDAGETAAAADGMSTEADKAKAKRGSCWPAHGCFAN